MNEQGNNPGTGHNTGRKNELPEDLLEEAASYLTILDERVMDSVEKIRFKTWLLQSPEHQQALEQVASIWGRMDVLQGLAEIFPIEDSAVNRQPISLENPSSGNVRKVAVAASVIVVFTAAIYTSGLWRITPEEETADPVYITEVVTEIGQIESIDMEDGSTILANTDSRLSVSVTETERRIVLDKGEAFFEVEHDPDRPFDVVVDDTIVRAVGTAFSVYRDDTQLKVIVSEGVVEVIHASRGANTESGSELLRPGQVASYGQSGDEITTVEQDELERKLFWRQGMLAFQGETLEQVIEEFSRYNEISFEIGSEEIRDIRVGGYFDSDDVAGMLTALQSNFNVQVTHIASDYVLLSASQ